MTQKGKELSIVEKVNSEIASEFGKADVQRALLATTFKGFKSVEQVKNALVEGMVRGFTFADFLKKNVYAIPYGETYSLVTSIDNVRKIAMRSGLAGRSEPSFEVDSNGRIISCLVVIKRRVDSNVDEYSARVYFDEYYAGNKDAEGNVIQTKWGAKKPTLWDTKPRTMIAKVAEMHALRAAFPEELAKQYVAEEMEREVIQVEAVDVTPAARPAPELIPADVEAAKSKLASARSVQELNTLWRSLSEDERQNQELVAFGKELKGVLLAEKTA